MLPATEMRAWAVRLLGEEALSNSEPRSNDFVTLSVYKKLRERFSEPMGTAGFEAIASRALALARSESVGLSTMQVMADGGLGEFGDSSQGRDAGIQLEAGVLFISQLLSLFLTFLGVATTQRLVGNAPCEGDLDAGFKVANPVEVLLQEVDQLRCVSERLEILGEEQPPMQDAIVAISANIRGIATLLDVYALIRNMPEELRSSAPIETNTNYLM